MKYNLEQHDSSWYLMGLPEDLALSSDGEGVEFEEPPEPEPNTWLWIPRFHDRLDFFEGVYAALYTKIHRNLAIREGDIFSTPVGQLVYKNSDLFPFDETAEEYYTKIQNFK